MEQSSKVQGSKIRFCFNCKVVYFIEKPHKNKRCHNCKLEGYISDNKKKRIKKSHSNSPQSGFERCDRCFDSLTYSDGLQINQVGQLLVVCHPPLRSLVQPHAEHRQTSVSQETALLTPCA